MVKIPIIDIQELVVPATKKVVILFLLLVATGIRTNNLIPVDAELPCSSDTECELNLRIGSKCVDGFCSNPFVGGCINTMLGEDFEANLKPEVLGALKGRVCNSDDGDDRSICLDNRFDYFEIRIHNSDWESSIFLAWIMQIMLMEVLKVPVTIGLNSGVTHESSFYSPKNTLPYSTVSYPWEALRVDDDCETTNRDCVDVMPEVWNGQSAEWINMMQAGVIEPVDGCGQVGKLGWFIPGATAKRDVSLVSYYGLQGEKNRAKLAQTFKRPTTWYEYCEEVSSNNCTTPDVVAAHYPESDSHAIKYFEEGRFTGYFRMLPENNCTLFPETCTGYMVGPKCSWSTNVDAQLYWNDIVGLKLDGPEEPNGGYGFSRQIEIWRAANATKSDVMMWWWQPEATVEEFTSTDWNFQQIILPTVTDICSKARVNGRDRCSNDITVRRGDPLGSCDNEAHALQKIISSSLEKKTMNEKEALRSPGYSYVRSLKVTDLEIQTMLKSWIAKNTDRHGNDAREAVCSYVVNNLDTLLGFIPPGHPKNIDPSGSFNQGYLYFAMAVAVFCFLGVSVTAGFVYRFRRTKVIVYAQETFVQIILFGFLLIIVGGFLYALKPTNISCVTRTWLTNLGFSIEIAAVLVKMSTINRIMQSSKKLKRVKVSRRAMFGSLGLLVMIELIFLTTWTIVSPPQAIEDMVLPTEFSTTVETSLICRSRYIAWPYVSTGWHSLLLIVASVLAFQSRDIIPDFNESRSIGTMIYSHFLFMILRMIILGIEGLIAPNVFGASMSLLYSLDTLFATTIYVIPKFIEAKKDARNFFMTSTVYVSTQGFDLPSAHSRHDLSSTHSRHDINMSNALRSNSNSTNSSRKKPRHSEINRFFKNHVSNLRGRQQRTTSKIVSNKASRASSSETPKEDNLHEDDWNIRSLSRKSNDISLMDDIQSDMSDGQSSTGGSETKKTTKNSLSSHDAKTAIGGGNITEELRKIEQTEICDNL